MRAIKFFLVQRKLGAKKVRLIGSYIPYIPTMMSLGDLEPNKIGSRHLTLKGDVSRVEPLRRFYITLPGR